MIIHVDMDAFYASVEIREQPELAPLPVVVGGREGRGVVAAANYNARKYGVRSAMPIVEAKRRCKSLICLPVRMPLYIEASDKIHEIFSRYTPEIEPLSLDEAFLDVTASEKLFKNAIIIGERIKQDILDETQLVCSVGIAENKYIAKIASDINKPNGFVFVNPGEQQAFLDPLPISRLWGAGKVTQKKFQAYGLATIADVRRQSDVFMQSIFGSQGQHFLSLARGEDPRRVNSETKSKSISHETTFETDIDDTNLLRSVLFDLSEQVSARLRRKKFKAKTVQLKLRYADFTTITRSSSLAMAENQTDILTEMAIELLLKERKKNKAAIRLIGMGTHGLISNDTDSVANLNDTQKSQQLELFSNRQSDNSTRQRNIDTISDKVNQRFGKKAVKRGRSFRKN